MPLSMTQASVPLLVQGLTAISAVLDKAAAHCAAKKIDEAALLTSRLYPDMFPMSRQIQIATDQARNFVARIAGLEVPKYPDTEASFAELKARIAKTIDFIHSVDTAKIDGTEAKELVVPLGARERNFTGQSYLLTFILPNFYFHLTTAYGLLRHAGVELGKRDFLG